MLKRLPLLVAALLFISIRGAPAEAAASAEVGMYALAFLNGVILTGARPVATELPGVQALEFRGRIIVRVGPDARPGTEVLDWCESFRGRHPNEVVYVSCWPITDRQLSGAERENRTSVPDFWTYYETWRSPSTAKLSSQVIPTGPSTCGTTPAPAEMRPD